MYPVRKHIGFCCKMRNPITVSFVIIIISQPCNVNTKMLPCDREFFPHTYCKDFLDTYIRREETLHKSSTPSHLVNAMSE